MSNKNDIIEINGRRYDANTGALVGAPVQAAQPLGHIKVRTSAEPKPAPVKAKPSRHPAKHAHPHAQSSSRLLMRQAVKKPAAHHKPRIKVQGILAAPPAPLSDLEPIRRAERRLVHAKQVAHSPVVKHFSAIPVSAYPETPVAVAAHHVPVHHAAPVRHPKHPQTTAELLEIALQAATSHEQAPLPKPRRHHLKRHIFARSHAA